MKKAIFLFLTMFFSLLSNTVWSQTDSLGIHKVNKTLWYFGIGGGPWNRGGSIDLSFTVVSAKNWGGSLNLRGGAMKSYNIPADYLSGFRIFTPMDDLNVFSFDFVKKFPTIEKYVRFGLETGLSWVVYDYYEFELNPNYGQLFEFKYNKINNKESTAGLSLALKVEFPFSPIVGCETTLYSNINDLRTILGFDICLNLGRVRN